MDPVLVALLSSWSWPPDVVTALLAATAAYLVGWARLRRTAEGAHVATLGRLVRYGSGLAMIVLALLSPVDTAASLLFTAHMLQHELLMLAAAPLLLSADPFPMLLWALPHWLRRSVGRRLENGTVVRAVFLQVTRMPVTGTAYLVVLWAWHVPAAYDAALRSQIVHDLQHLSIFATAVLFWWPIINPAPRWRAGSNYLVRAVYVLGTAILAMMPIMWLLVLPSEPIYAHYLTVPRLWEISALTDQRVGWVLMGSWDALTFMIVLLILVARAFEEDRRLTRAQSAAAIAGPGLTPPSALHG